MGEIGNALDLGKEVITHTDSVSVPGWSGAGYVIFDPTTGDATYRISGGHNGGWAAFFGFVKLLLVFAVAIAAVHAAVVAGPFVLIAVGLFELFSLSAYVDSIKKANSKGDFETATLGYLLVALMGFIIPTAGLTPASGLFEIAATKWFGIVIGSMLTNPFGWFY